MEKIGRIAGNLLNDVESYKWCVLLVDLEAVL